MVWVCVCVYACPHQLYFILCFLIFRFYGRPIILFPQRLTSVQSHSTPLALDGVLDLCFSWIHSALLLSGKKGKNSASGLFFLILDIWTNDTNALTASWSSCSYPEISFGLSQFSSFYSFSDGSKCALLLTPTFWLDVPLLRCLFLKHEVWLNALVQKAKVSSYVLLLGHDLLPTCLGQNSWTDPWYMTQPLAPQSKF